MENKKIDWDDILIIPEILSDISSRSEINIYNKNGKLPLITAPMDTVIDNNNAKIFEDNNINVCLPRNIKYENIKNDNYFYSYGLDEIIYLIENNEKLPKKILIDIANGHMIKLYNIAKKIKETYGNNIELMIGNIANPKTYKAYCEIGVDYVRTGVGNGGACLTSKNVSIGYPMASLIKECYDISLTFDKPAKIVADGGFKNYSDIIKAFALGADMVMLGSIFNKALESIGETYTTNIKHQYNTVPGEKVDQFNQNTIDYFKNGGELYKKFRGMSTKEAQKNLGCIKLKTSEGVNRMQKVEYTLSGWIENFSHYMKSAMSYTGSHNLDEFIGMPEIIEITQNSFNRFNK
jgi:IMP dehydrogenase